MYDINLRKILVILNCCFSSSEKYNYYRKVNAEFFLRLIILKTEIV